MRALAAALAAAFVGRARGACAYADPKCVVVVCCGDSITAGSGASDGRDWPNLVQQRLGDAYLVINKGRSGKTAGDWHSAAYVRSKEFQAAVSFKKADAYVVALGTNDAKAHLWSEGGGRAFQASYGRLLDSLVAARPDDPPVIIAAAPVPQLEDDYKSWEDASIINDQMPGLIQQVARQKGALYRRPARGTASSETAAKSRGRGDFGSSSARRIATTTRVFLRDDRKSRRRRGSSAVRRIRGGRRDLDGLGTPQVRGR